MTKPKRKGEKIKRYYKITPFGDENYCVVEESGVGSAIQSWVEGMSVGYGLKVEVIEMTDKKFNSLPEYE